MDRLDRRPRAAPARGLGAGRRGQPERGAYARVTARFRSTPAEKVAAIEAEYEDALKAFSEAYKAAKTDEEKQKISRNEYPKSEKWFPRLMEIAKAHPADPAAVKALSWVVNQDDDSEAGHEALAVLARDHMASPELTDVVDGLAYSVNADAEAFLRGVADRSPNERSRAARGTRSRSCSSTSQASRSGLPRPSDPEARKIIEKQFDAKKLARLEAVDVAKTAARDREHPRDREGEVRRGQARAEAPRSASAPIATCSRSATSRSARSRPRSRARTSTASRSS